MTLELNLYRFGTATDVFPKVGVHVAMLGHAVKVIHPAYVKPFVQMHKNDQRDAQAIAEAAVRPNIPAVSVKSQEQLDLQAIHRVRELP